MAPFDATTNPYGGALWQYLAANVRKKSDSSYALPDIAASPGTSDGGTWYDDCRRRRGRLRRCGHRGACRRWSARPASPTSRSPASSTRSTPRADRAQGRRRRRGRAARPRGCRRRPRSLRRDSNDNAFGRIVNGVDANVNAIVSGHTHLAYNHVINGRSRSVSAGPVRREPQPAGQFTVRRPTPTRSTVTDQVTIDVADVLDAAAPTQTAIDGERPPQVHGRPVDAAIVDAVAGQTSSAPSELGKLARPLRPCAASPTAPPRTAAASPPSATSSPRCSAGRRSTPEAGARRSPS